MAPEHHRSFADGTEQGSGSPCLPRQKVVLLNAICAQDLQAMDFTCDYAIFIPAQGTSASACSGSVQNFGINYSKLPVTEENKC